MALNAFANVFRIAELRSRLIYTLALLAVYRIGIFINTPGVDRAAMNAFMDAQRQSGGLFSLFNLFSGGALDQMSIFGLGIMPYVSASIIIQLLAVVVPSLERLQKEGAGGRQKINQYTRYGTIVLSIIQGIGISRWLASLGRADAGQSGFNQIVVPDDSAWFTFMTVISLTAGTAFIMWLGERITERGIGNGISLIIFAGIVVGLVPAIGSTVDLVQKGNLSPIVLIPLLVFMVLVVGFIVYMERAQRRIPVQYAKRVVGRRVYGGQSTYLPLRVNTGGVIPVIFASSIVTVPTVIAGLIQNEGVQRVANYVAYGQPIYYFLQVVTIIFFSYFYVSIIFNPTDLAENMRKYGGFIPGIRPGKRTAEYIDRILTRLTLVGAIYLAAVTVLPEFLLTGIHVQGLPFLGPRIANFFPTWFTEGLGIQFYFGGTSLLIVVGVAMDTIQQIESQLVMRNYEGFMKRGRIRGRRG